MDEQDTGTWFDTAGLAESRKKAYEFETEPRPYADPDAAARKLVEIARTIEPVQDGRICVELVNVPILKAGGSPDEYRAGIDSAIARGWLWRHESGTYVRFTEAGAALFA